MKDEITRTVFRYVLLLVLMYGFYVVAHGHLSPGGGFAGGVILGLGALLYLLVFDLGWRERFRNLPLDIAVVLIGLGSLMEAIKYLLPTKHGPTGLPGGFQRRDHLGGQSGDRLAGSQHDPEHLLFNGRGAEGMNWGALIANFPHLVSVVVFNGIIIVLT